MLTWFLKARSENGFRQSTEDIMARILRLYVASGTLTASTAIVYFALFIVFHDKANTAYIVPAMMPGKLYTNSMLVLLNQRRPVGGGTSISYVDTSEMPYPRFSQDREAGTSASGLSGLRGGSGMKMTRTVELAMDTVTNSLGKPNSGPPQDDESVPHSEVFKDKPKLLAS
jgi:hypothetical protein